MVCIGHDVSEDLEYIPALLFIIEYLLKKYACKKCQNGVVQAKRPPRPIPKARPAAGLLAYILVSKYQDHLPLHRLERIFARHGMEISRKTLCDWVQVMAKLLRPIVEAMKRGLLLARLLQADETPVQVKDLDVKGKTSRCWIWT
jgi:transposase